MTTETGRPRSFSPLVFSKWVSIAVACLGLMVLAGWVFNIHALGRNSPAWVSMKANTALGLLLCGASLWLIREKDATGTRRGVSQLLGLGVALLGILTWSEYIFGWEAHLDQLLAKDTLGKSVPGRPAMPTALNFTLMGLALMTLDWKRRPNFAQVLNLTAVLISLLALIGYACGFSPFYGQSMAYPDTRMGLNTAVAFVFLGAGIFCARPHLGLMLILTADTGGRLMARRLLWVPVVVPLLLGLIQLKAGKTALEHREMVVWLFALANILVFTLIIWWNASVLYKSDLERRGAEDEIKAAYSQLESFSYSVSHDLKSPLRAIKGYSKFIQEDYGEQLPEEGRKHLNAVGANVERMERLIEDLLAFSKFTNRPVEKERVLLDDLARKTFEDLHREVKAREIEFELGTLPACQADPTLIKQVLENLLSNALKFSRNRKVSKIEMGFHPTADEAGRWVYFVKDNGAGFDMKYSDKLFGVFQRLHHASDFEGTGVGLAIVQNIINRHGGRIWAEAVENEGACFYFSLPKAKGA
ncbi:MAG: hypothetical protein JWQ71_4712 [Pedosphaera sp.]|nr:hypothetical protein [Pedosphaera sp.]